jgi:hypothetical protein
MAEALSSGRPRQVASRLHAHPGGPAGTDLNALADEQRTQPFAGKAAVSVNSQVQPGHRIGQGLQCHVADLVNPGMIPNGA